MTQSRAQTSFRRQKGFSLVELMLTVLLLAIAMAIATNGLMQMQKRASADTGKVDMTQMSRQFVDQIVNDLHQTGYPGLKIYDATVVPTPTTASVNVAAGLLAVDANAVEFEADVDGSGNVSHVYLELLWSNGTPVSAGPGACPCTLQRGTLYKAQVGKAAIPYYTEVNNVTNTNIFSAYLFDGTPVALPASASDLPNIKNIKVTVNVQSSVQEMDGTFPTITLASEAKINN
jgi:prepilin-type N-terminal cleavage/methylation domain-containing protein